MADAEPRGNSATGTLAVPAEASAPSAADAGESAVCFFCSVCGSRLTAPVAVQGRSLTCFYCLRLTAVPIQPLGADEPAAAVSLWERERILSIWMRFLCPACGAKLAADARAGGAEADCPHCGHRVQVPRVLRPANPEVAGGPAVAVGPAPVATGPVAAAAAGSEPKAVLTADEVRFLTAKTHG